MGLLCQSPPSIIKICKKLSSISIFFLSEVAGIRRKEHQGAGEGEGADRRSHLETQRRSTAVTRLATRCQYWTAAFGAAGGAESDELQTVCHNMQVLAAGLLRSNQVSPDSAAHLQRGADPLRKF